MLGSCFGLNYWAIIFCQTTKITEGHESAVFLKTNPLRANFANRPQFYYETLYMYVPIHETLQLQLKVVKVSCQEEIHH